MASHAPVDIPRLREAGLTAWYYTADAPYHPWANVRLDNDLIDGRMQIWVAAHEQAQGYLYWGLNIWRSGYLNYRPIDLDAPTVLLNRSSWGVSTYGGFSSRVKPEEDWLQGDGVLMYAAEGGRPIGSIRLENVRDGLEDVALLYQLQHRRGGASARAGRGAPVEGVAALTGPLVRNQTSFSRTAAEVEAYRERILEELAVYEAAARAAKPQAS